jgi:hypothetical protein
MSSIFRGTVWERRKSRGLVSHPAVAERLSSASHEIKEQEFASGVKDGQHVSDELQADLVKHVAAEIGPIAKLTGYNLPRFAKDKKRQDNETYLEKIAQGDVEYLATGARSLSSVVEKLPQGSKEIKPTAIRMLCNLITVSGDVIIRVPAIATKVKDGSTESCSVGEVEMEQSDEPN